VAALRDHQAIVEYLLSKGASINYVNKTGASALASATKNGHYSIAEYLKSKGANPAVEAVNAGEATS
jgi:ankyrin repeat protein